MPKPPSCDFPPGRQGKDKGPLKSRLMRHRADFSWTGVGTEKYKEEESGWSGVIRRTLVGLGGERAKFHIRYFELAPGGRTSLERHRHEHVVICARGKGRCRAGRRSFGLSPFDVLYIAPDEAHRLENASDGPFGFFCIVDARRDRPRPVEEKAGRAALKYSAQKGKL